MQQTIFESATMFHYGESFCKNTSPFHSIIEVAAVQSGSYIFDTVNNKAFNYSESNLAKGILYSQFFCPKKEKNAIDRDFFWKTLHERAQLLKTDQCLIRDLRAGFPENMPHECMIAVAIHFAQSEFTVKNYFVDVNIHLHRAEIPHCHFLIPTIDWIEGDSIDEFVAPEVVERMEFLWKRSCNFKLKEYQ